MTSKEKWLATLLCLLVAAIGLIFPSVSNAAQDAVADKAEVAVPDAAKRSASEMLIASGDLLEVSVYGTDFDKQVRVNDAGEISLPLVGPVKVGGLSLDRAEQKLASEFSQGGYFVDPQVSVFEREYSTQAISVLGAVQKPGLYQLPGNRTLFDAIAAAGGTTATAGDTVTVTHRGHSAQPQIVSLSYDPKSSGSKMRVHPGDTVVVAKAGIVYVVGDVREPKAIALAQPQMTVLEAISIAGGANPTAALGRCRVIRRTAHGPKEIPVPLKKILAAKTPDMPLQPADILFVPSSAAKSAGRRGLEAIVQMATGMAIYRPY